jgi:hypothetical protein
MKKKTFFLILTVALILTFLTSMAQADWKISSLTSDIGSGFYPAINDSGHIVWSGSDGSGYEIYYYDGTTTTQITNSSSENINPSINAYGDVVFTQYGKTFLALEDLVMNIIKMVSKRPLGSTLKFSNPLRFVRVHERFIL